MLDMMMEDYIVTGWNRVLENQMKGREFEEFCVDFLCAAGFWQANLTPGSNDGGVDILASNKDVKYAIQCKRQTGMVGPGAVRDVIGGKDFYISQGFQSDFAVVMTNSYFSKHAKETAKTLGVLLWDRDWFLHTAEETGVILL